MEIIKAEIVCNRLEIYLTAGNDNMEERMIVLRRRAEGGFTQQDIEIKIKKDDTSENAEYAATLYLDEFEQDGIYWDILIKDSRKNKVKKIKVQDNICNTIREKAVADQYWFDDYSSIRLYPNTKGNLYLKRIEKGVSYQAFSEKEKIGLEKFVTGGSGKIVGNRLVKLTKCDDGNKIEIEIEKDDDIKGGVFKLVLVSELNSKKVILDLEVIQNKLVLNMSQILEKITREIDTFRVYIAAEKNGRYYWFRLRESRTLELSEHYSYIEKDHYRYLEKIDIDDKKAAVFFKGIPNDFLGLTIANVSEADMLVKGENRIVTEKTDYDYKFKFTFVIAVYNVEKYLSEAIESVIKQDIGFKDNIQLVLVDDGATDSSPEICDYYKKLYPSNIQVVHKKNGGVSSARNAGKAIAEGRYVNFMDSDDWISNNTCTLVWDFFEEYLEEIDVVSIPMMQFGAIEEEHWQNYKFENGTRKIDLREEYTISCMNSAASFIKNRMVKKYDFDESLDHAEDLKFMLQIVPEKMEIGVVAEATYYYRRHPIEVASLVSSGKSKKNFYSHSLDKLAYETFEKWLNKCGYIPKFVQNTIMIDLQWKFRMKEVVWGVLSEEEEAEYILKLKGTLRYIDDDIILAQKKISVEHKCQLLRIKHGEEPQQEKVYKDIIYHYENLYIGRASKLRVQIDFLTVEDKCLILDGYATMFECHDESQIETYISVGGVMIKCERGNHQIEKRNIAGIAATCVPFYIKMNIDEKLLEKDIYIYTSVNGHIVARRNPFYGKFAPFSQIYKTQYCKKEDYILCKKGSGFVVKKHTDKLQMQLEEQYLLELQYAKKEAIENNDLVLVESIGEAIELRKEYFELKNNKKKEIWMISDRLDVAGDNGEAFFEYLNEKQINDVDYYFFISEESKDYERLSKTGKVIAAGSKKHKLYILLADKIISAHVDDFVLEPFNEASFYLKDLKQYKFVFLQHGITKDDLSTWLNKYNKNIKLFITASEMECDSIINGEYVYSEKEVKLTGFPRYDKLYDETKKKKQIVFMPTWRAPLASAVDPITGKRVYNPKFKQSTFYKFYQQLIQDERIIDAMKKGGYKGKFFLHPGNIENIGDFVGNDVIEIEMQGADYQKEFCENALLVTDYSSVAFDFAYLRKPVLYVQHDREEFFFGQTYDKGYWDYKQMGFGPVCESYEETVEQIVNIIEKDCVIEQKYAERLEKFYYKFDRNNCERVYNEIKGL